MTTHLMAIVTLMTGANHAGAEVALSVDGSTATEWQAMPHWQPNPSERESVTTQGDALDFCVPEPGHGMKWTYDFDTVDVFAYRWLVVKYRMVNLAPVTPDYLFWCNADTGNDGLRFMPPGEPPWDDEWHVVAYDLQRMGAGDEISTLGAQCRAGAAGDAHLLIERMELTDRPPPDAEGSVADMADARTVELDVLRPDEWTHHDGWQNSPAETHAVEATPDGVGFSVGDPGFGMKWSAGLEVPVEGMLYLTARVRAQNIRPLPWEYFIYLADTGGGNAPDEQYCVSLSDVPTDGEWHVVTAPVTVKSINTLAVQVQALGGKARAEIDWIRLSTTKPEVALEDMLACKPAARMKRNERALEVVGPLADAAEAKAALELTTWFAEPMINVRGVTFELAGGGKSVAATPFSELGEIELRDAGQASEIYLLLAAKFARSEEDTYGGGQLRKVTYPHRFVASVEYENGTVDEFMPAVLPGEGPPTGYGVKAGIGAYVIGPLAGKSVARVVLKDGMRRGRFLLAAATANTGRPRFPVDLKPRATANPRQASATANAKGVASPADVGLTMQAAGLGTFEVPGPLASVKVNGETAELAALEDIRRSQAPGINVAGVLNHGGARLTVSLTTEPDTETSGTRMRLQLVNAGDEAVEIQPTFPELAAIEAPAKWGETWYFFPRRGPVINHIPIGLREAYSGAFPFQVESLFWPEAGCGLCMLTRDQDLTARHWRLTKDSGSAGMSIQYPSMTLEPGETWESVETVVGAHGGDWHEAWGIYRRWLETWYEPAAPRKEWFRRIFNFRQHFLHFELPEKSGMFDSESKEFHVDEVLDGDIEAFGGIDYLHIFDWGWSKQFGRCGDYDHWEQLGGAENFARAIEGTHDRGIPVGLYIEGYLVDPPSNYGKAHGEEYQILDRNGEPLPNFAPSYNMCSGVPEWQDYLAGVYGRTKEATGARGYYVDQMGFVNPSHTCYAEDHGHPVPQPPAPAQHAMLRKIREALGPDAAMYTEESPPDVLGQVQDGSFTYNHRSVSDEWSPTRLNLYRFTIPSFKTIEIIVCDKPTGSNVQAIKRVFFSGEGIWLEGIRDLWWTPEAQAEIRRTYAVLTEYADAFVSDAPTPLIPTLTANVHANEFPADDGDRLTAWTLYNANPRTVRGPMLRVKHIEGAEYRDAWNGRPADVEIEGKMATVSVELGPLDVGCIVRTVGM